MAESALSGDLARDDAYIRRKVEPLLGRALGPVHRADLDLYLAELRSWGARLDLVAPRDAGEFLDLALWDAAVLAREESLRGDASDRLVDVGSGGGAPGIPLGIFLASLRGTQGLSLVEPRAKRVTFLRSVTARLSSVRIDVVKGRSDELPGKSFEVAVSRATLPPAEWLLEGGRLATKAVWVLLARSEAPADGAWVSTAAVDYEWPLVGHDRRAVRYTQT
jgi:16S rRNA (guanine527-N7)-methyltransferase